MNSSSVWLSLNQMAFSPVCLVDGKPVMQETAVVPSKRSSPTQNGRFVRVVALSKVMLSHYAAVCGMHMTHMHGVSCPRFVSCCKLAVV
jgi:hypothetical protein